MKSLISFAVRTVTTGGKGIRRLVYNRGRSNDPVVEDR